MTHALIAQNLFWPTCTKSVNSKGSYWGRLPYSSGWHPNGVTWGANALIGETQLMEPGAKLATAQIEQELVRRRNGLSDGTQFCGKRGHLMTLEPATIGHQKSWPQNLEDCT